MRAIMSKEVEASLLEIRAIPSLDSSGEFSARVRLAHGLTLRLDLDEWQTLKAVVDDCFSKFGGIVK